MKKGTRRRLILIASVLGVCVAALVAVALPNEFLGGEQLERLEGRDVSKTELLRVELAITRQADRCVLFAGHVLATQLSVEELGRAFSSRADGLVWAAPGRFPASTPEGKERQAPAPAVALLTQWAIVPEGVRRVVVFREVPVRSRWDPRCW